MIRKRIKQLSILSLIMGILGAAQIEYTIMDIAYKLFNVLLPVLIIPIVSIIALVLGIICKKKIKELGINNETIEKDKKRANIGIILSVLGIIRFFGDIYLFFF